MNREERRSRGMKGRVHQAAEALPEHGEVEVDEQAKLMGQAGFVGRLQQPRPEVTADFDEAAMIGPAGSSGLRFSVSPCSISGSSVLPTEPTPRPPSVRPGGERLGHTCL